MQSDETLYTLIIFSENLPGVLNHITTVFTRRQVNIESLNVSASSIEGLHRYTITCYSTELVIEKIAKQIEKIIDVVSAKLFHRGRHLYSRNGIVQTFNARGT